MPVTLDKVARRARVSAATVSRVLNNTGRVGETTRARVLRAVEELNYHPNIAARTLAHGRSRTLGLVVSNLKNPFFLDVFQTLEGDAHKRGLEVVVANTDYQPRQLLTHVNLMRGRRLAGLALIVSETDPALLEGLADAKMPLVFLDEAAAPSNAVNITVDYARGTRRAVEYLHSLGHRRFAFVGHHTTLEPLDVRRRSFLETVKSCCTSAKSTTVADEDSPHGGLHATQHLLGTGFDPTAIVCVNDLMALGAVKALREKGLRVPEDVSVVGCDNIGLSEFAAPPLTTINIPRDRIGHTISEALMPADGESRVLGRTIVIEPELIIRDSTGPPPQETRQAASMTGSSASA
jgi:DNA-binding LacI/PurR family transcriptional regulator